MAKSIRRELKPDDPIFHGGVLSKPENPMQGAIDAIEKSIPVLRRRSQMKVIDEED